SHFAHAYFSRVGCVEFSVARRAFMAFSIAGSSSRVIVAIVSATSTVRPLTVFFPNRSGNFWVMSSRILITFLLSCFCYLRIGYSWGHAQHFAIWPFCGHPGPAFLTIFHRPDSNGEFIAGLQCVAAPAAALEEIRTHAFHAPRVGAAL